ncbi:MAG: thrombospondin type 3 repeat-containing protein [Proteobacteria bacterium]|nr:thrombospondin type 3 repeat-containing protein [Pseudomonadota bacterium]
MPASMSASLLVYIYDGNWTYSAAFIDASLIPAGRWTKLSLAVPANAATPLEALGVQIYASNQGSFWIDNISNRTKVQSTDSDGDGVSDSQDNCPLDYNPDQADKDGDALGDACDDDNDNDGVSDNEDNCVSVANSSQADTDGDGKGDACDEDIDGDGVLNAQDNCVLDTNPDQRDFDGDKIGDACDDDSDGDGVIDATDACLETPAGVPVGDDGCSVDQTCPVQNNWKNHRAYVRCVAYTASKFRAAGLITDQARRAAIFEAARKHIVKIKDKKKSLRKPKSLRSHKHEWKQKRKGDFDKAEKERPPSSKRDYYGYSSRFLRD